MKLGLGYVFGGRDKGLGRMLGKTTGGVLGLNKALQATNRLAGAAGALTINGLNNIESKLEEIGSGNVNQLTTSLQNQATAFDKEFAKAAGSIGIFGDEMKAMERKAFSAAYGLNADTQIAQDAMLMLKKTGLTEKDLGLDSFEAVIKAIDTTGISAQDLIGTAADLKKSYGMAEPGKFLDMMVQQSTAMGLGTDAMGQMTAMLGDMDSAFAQTLKKEAPEDVMKTTQSLLQLAGAMKETLGTDGAKSMEAAMGLFKTLSEEAQAFPKMAAGLDESFGPLLESLSIEMPGGFQEAFKSMEKDPLTFAKTMAKLYSDLEEKGATDSIQRLNASLEPLGADFLQLVQSGKKFQAVVGNPEFAKGGAESLQKFSDATYRTNLTLDDQIERMKDVFKTKLFGFVGDRTREFVKNQGERYKALGDAIGIALGKIDVSKPAEQMTLLEKVAIKARENGFGPLIENMIVFGQIGPSMFSDILDVVGQIAPVLMALDALGVGGVFTWIGGMAGSLAALAGGPLTAVLAIGAAFAAAVGGVFLFNKALDGDMGPAMQSIASSIYTNLIDALDFGRVFFMNLATSINSMTGEEIIDAGVNKLKAIILRIMMSAPDSVEEPGPLGQMSDAFMSALEMAFDAVVAKLPSMQVKMGEIAMGLVNSFIDFYKSGGGASEISQSVRMYFMKLDFASVGQAIMTKFAEIRGKITDGLVKLFDNATTMLDGVDFVSLGSTVGDMIMNAALNMLMNTALLGGVLVKGFAYLGVFMAKYLASGDFFGDIFSLALSSTALMRKVSVAFMSLVLGAWLGAGKAMVNAWGNIGELLLVKINETVAWAKEAFQGMWDFIYDGAFSLFGNSINTMVEHDFGKIFDILETAKLWFTSLFDFVAGPEGIFTRIGSAISGAFDTVYLTVQSIFDKISSAFWAIWDGIKSGLSSLGSVIGSVGAYIMGEDPASRPPATNDGGRAAADAAASSRAKLFAQADIRSLMELTDRKLSESILILKEISSNTLVKPETIAVPAQGAKQGRGSSNGRTPAGQT